MLSKKIKKFLNHYQILKAAKLFFFNGFVANSDIYKRFVIKKAHRVAREKQEFKEYISIETALTCNARCIFCGHNKKVMTGIMSQELFEKIINECCEYGIKKIMLGVYGEVFTDKDIFKKIKYIRRLGMKYGIITNGSLLSRQMTDKLFELGGLSYVNFSVNAFSEEVYEKTMKGPNRDITYGNILYFLEQKEKWGDHDMEVTVSAVETKFNKKDFKKFSDFWKSKRGIYLVQSAELLPITGGEHDENIGKLGPMTQKTNQLFPCRMLWDRLCVYYDGKVGACCLDGYKRRLIVGDLTVQTVEEVSRGEALNNLRSFHLEGKRSSHPICGKCYYNSIWYR
jgi:pyruvate-formate lyase-activating enzyme